MFLLFVLSIVNIKLLTSLSPVCSLYLNFSKSTTLDDVRAPPPPVPHLLPRPLPNSLPSPPPRPHVSGSLSQVIKVMLSFQGSQMTMIRLRNGPSNQISRVFRSDRIYGSISVCNTFNQVITLKHHVNTPEPCNSNCSTIALQHQSTCGHVFQNSEIRNHFETILGCMNSPVNLAL